MHEDLIYVPQDSFPAIHGNFSHNYNDLICCTYKYFIYLQLDIICQQIIWQIPKTTLSAMKWMMKVLCIMDQVSIDWYFAQSFIFIFNTLLNYYFKKIQVLTLNHIKNQSLLQNVYKQIHMIVYIIMCPVVIIF